MFQLSRFQLLLTFVALMMLRVTVGYHFFKEGTTKLKSGTFTSAHFLTAAQGPWADHFKQMVDDPDGRLKLCVTQKKQKDGTVVWKIDSKITELLWEDFVDRTTDYYDFGTPRKGVDAETRKKIAKQPERADAILKNHIDLLRDFLDEHKTEILAHYRTEDREKGFQRDGPRRAEVATEVESVRKQVATIRSDRQLQLRKWSAEVTDIWDSLEDQINQLAIGSQAIRPPYSLHRPFDQPGSMQKWVDRMLPWFDTVVGVLLVLGLFSRIASLAAAVLLISVVATQPFWIPGTVPTYYQWVELAACFVIFSTCAGRYGGLDHFVHAYFKRPNASEGTHS